MTISSSVTNKAVVLKLSDESTLQDFAGYQLERRYQGGAWMVWNGLGWAVDTPSIFTETDFADFGLADGLYQYRVAVYFIPGTLGEYAYTGWQKIGDTRVGWTLGNYMIPDGSWGEVLTADDMRFTYLWGIDFRSTSGENYTDHQVRFSIESALEEMERALNLTIKKRRIVCDANNLEGVEYDETESPYPFRHERWSRTGFIPLRRRPVLSVERFELWSIVDQKVMDLKPWMRLSGEKGMLNYYPKVGPTGIINVNPISALGTGYMMGGDHPHGFRVDYTAGYPSAAKIPADLRDIVGKVASCKLLNIIGDGLIAGFSSSSLSLDGVSESFSSTQSAENAYFSARIKQYLKDIEDWMTNNARKFRHMPMGYV